MWHRDRITKRACAASSLPEMPYALNDTSHHLDIGPSTYYPMSNHSLPCLSDDICGYHCACSHGSALLSPVGYVLCACHRNNSWLLLSTHAQWYCSLNSSTLRGHLYIVHDIMRTILSCFLRLSLVSWHLLQLPNAYCSTAGLSISTALQRLCSKAWHPRLSAALHRLSCLPCI